MIKTSELKIGNWFEFNNKHYQVSALDHNSITVYDEVGRLIPEVAAEPIQLTKEWLIRMKDNKNKTAFPYWVKYVHEAQNWYYWNNNKTELTIK